MASLTDYPRIAGFSSAAMGDGHITDAANDDVHHAFNVAARPLAKVAQPLYVSPGLNALVTG